MNVLLMFRNVFSCLMFPWCRYLNVLRCLIDVWECFSIFYWYFGNVFRCFIDIWECFSMINWYLGMHFDVLLIFRNVLRCLTNVHKRLIGIPTCWIALCCLFGNVFRHFLFVSVFSMCSYFNFIWRLLVPFQSTFFLFTLKLFFHRRKVK